ncbi:MAG: hypothetical protein RIC80_05605 [Cyclobacteriaceae bacterium]
MTEVLNPQDIEELREILRFRKELSLTLIKRTVISILIMIVPMILLKGILFVIALGLVLLVTIIIHYQICSKPINQIKKDLRLRLKWVELLSVEIISHKKPSKQVRMSNGLKVGLAEFETHGTSIEEVAEGKNYLIEYASNSEYIFKITQN